MPQTSVHCKDMRRHLKPGAFHLQVHIEGAQLRDVLVSHQAVNLCTATQAQ